MKARKRNQQKNNFGLLFFIGYLLQKYLFYFKDLFQFFHTESRLAYAATVRIIKITFAMCFFLGVTWITLLFTLYQYLISLNYPAINASLLLVAINLICLFALYFYAKYLKRKLSFDGTKRQLRKIIS